MPDFLIVGAARSATTSLHHYLAGHRQIVMSRTKEPNYFLFDHRSGSPTPLIEPDARLLAKSVSDLDEYQRLFTTPGEPGAVVGEVSPLYLYVRETPERIASTLPGVKLIAVLRDPIERALSHHSSLNQYDGDRSVTDFGRAVEAELDQPGYTPYATGTHLLRLGRYGEQLARYREHFAPDQLLVLSFDELAADPSQALGRICEFLGVDPSHDFGDLVAYNGSRAVRSRLARRLRAPLARAQPWLKGALPPRVVAPLAKLRARAARPAEHPILPPDLHERLVAYFRDDVDRLGSLVDFDLGGWLQPA